MEEVERNFEFANKLLKLVLPLRVCDLGKVNPGEEGALLLCSFNLITYSKLMTAFCSSCGNHVTSTCCRHAFTVTVLVGALFITWLKCAFHESGYFGFNFVIQKGHQYKEIFIECERKDSRNSSLFSFEGSLEHSGYFLIIFRIKFI